MGKKNLAGRAGFIVAVVVIFVYGIIGIPHGGLKQSITDRINLGLDLRGGTHLVLQVHVAEAINASTATDVQRLNTALSATGGTAAKLNPAHPEVITVSGFQPTQAASVHDVLEGTGYSAYDVAPAPNGGFTMTMKQAAIRDLETRTLQQSIETIRDRVDALGVSEPVIEQYGLGDNQILVQLPGVSDPAHVESIIQSTAKLEIHEVVNSYPDQQQALSALGGAVPPDEELLPGVGAPGTADRVWVLKRASVVAGPDFRDAQPSTDQNGRPDITFNLTTEAGDRFYKYTDANKGTGSMAIVLETMCAR